MRSFINLISTNSFWELVSFEVLKNYDNLSGASTRLSLVKKRGNWATDLAGPVLAINYFVNLI
jgi:hypothetical protein